MSATLVRLLAGRHQELFDTFEFFLFSGLNGFNSLLDHGPISRLDLFICGPTLLDVK